MEDGQGRQREQQKWGKASGRIFRAGHAENTGSLAPHGEPPGAGSLSELPWGNLPTWASP